MSWIFQNPEARMITDTMVEGVRKVRNGSTMRMNKVVDEIRIETPAAAAAMIRAALPKEQKEERVFVLPLDAYGKVLAKPILVSVGHQDGTAAIDAGTIFREALKAGAEEIIVAHNHPSGDPMPSKADYDTTVKLNDGASLVGLELIDHLIIGTPESANGFGFVSMAELLAG